MHVSLTAELESRIKAKVESGLYNKITPAKKTGFHEVKLAQLRERLKIGTDQLDHGKGLAIESIAALDALFDDIKA